MSKVVTKAFALKALVEEGAESGRFSGIAAPYDQRDSYGDVLRPQVFAKSIRDNQGQFPLMWMHNHEHTIGSVEVTNDGRTSLNIVGTLLTDAVAKAGEIYALLKAKAIKGLSVSFLPIRYEPFRDGSGLEFHEARLVEVSLCPVPAFSQAQVVEVRSIVNSTVEADVVKALRTFDMGRWKVQARR